jgi:hypothetical protein
MERPNKPTEFILHLQPPRADDAGAAYRRLRALLKTAWRSFGLRCTRVVADDAIVTAEGIAKEDETKS